MAKDKSYSPMRSVQKRLRELKKKESPSFRSTFDKPEQLDMDVERIKRESEEGVS
jgi:uncharacterized protein YdcH (DUF465 family)